jgi:hypothetical protein
VTKNIPLFTPQKESFCAMKFIELDTECQVCVSVTRKRETFEWVASGNQLEKKERKIFIVRVHRDPQCEKHVEHIFSLERCKNNVT